MVKLLILCYNFACGMNDRLTDTVKMDKYENWAWEFNRFLELCLSKAKINKMINSFVSKLLGRAQNWLVDNVFCLRENS